MDFYFCGRYIYTNGDNKEVERDMYAAISYFRGSNDHNGYEKQKDHLEYFFSYFFSTPKQKYYYAQMKLAGEVYWQWKDNCIDCGDWLIL